MTTAAMSPTTWWYTIVLTEQGVTWRPWVTGLNQYYRKGWPQGLQYDCCISYHIALSYLYRRPPPNTEKNRCLVFTHLWRREVTSRNVLIPRQRAGSRTVTVQTELHRNPSNQRPPTDKSTVQQWNSFYFKSTWPKSVFTCPKRLFLKCV